MMEYCKFLEHYRRYTVGNETPESFHLWCGLVGISGAAERRFWIEQNIFKLILNLYIMFLAPAGVCAKSTAMGLCTGMLEEIGVKVAQGSITKRKLVDDMQANVQECDRPDGKKFVHTSLTFAADEFNELLGSGGAEIIKFLTTIFSQPKRYEDRTMTQGSWELIRPCLTIVGNVIPEWFAQGLANDMGATGLLARFIIVSENLKRGSFPRPVMTKEQLHHRAKALEILFWIQQNFGEVRLSEEADNYFVEWYDGQLVSPDEDFRFAQYLERKTKVHVLKVAALMALGDCRQVIEKIDIERSIYIINEADVKLSRAYKLIGNNKYAVYINKIISILDMSEGRYSMRKLHCLFSSNLMNDEFIGVIKQVENMGIAKPETIQGVAYLVKMKEEK